MARPALDPQQRRVLAAFKRRAASKQASPIERKALIEAGLTEADLHNPNYGDRDSIGSLQERSTYGSAAHRLDPSLAADRFLTEARAAKRPGMSAGELAQAVQRSAFPGRYDQHSAEADALLSGSPTASAAKSGSHTVRTSRTIPGVDNSDTRRALILQFLQQRHNPQALVSLASGLQGAQDTPSRKVYSSKTVKGSSPSGAPANKSKLLELFYNGPGGINAKDGQREPRGFVSGHTDHVHVAAGPKTVVALGDLAEQMGLHVGENPHFGGVHPVHVKNSNHYKGEAIDVSGTPAQMQAYNRKVAALYGLGR